MLMQQILNLLPANGGDPIQVACKSVESDLIITASGEFPLRKGDVFERVTGAGVRERFEVVVPGRYERMGSFAPHYQAKVRPIDIPEAKEHAEGHVKWETVKVRPNFDVEEVVDWRQVLRGMARDRGYEVEHEVFTDRGAAVVRLGIPGTPTPAAVETMTDRYRRDAEKNLTQLLATKDRLAFELAMKTVRGHNLVSDTHT